MHDTGGSHQNSFGLWVTMLQSTCMEPSGCLKQNSVALLVQYLGLSYVGQLLHNYAMYLFRSNDANAHMQLNRMMYIFDLANSWQWLLFIEGLQCICCDHLPSVFNFLVERTKRIIIEIDEVADADILVILKKVLTNAVSLFSYIQVANSST